MTTRDSFALEEAAVAVLDDLRRSFAEALFLVEGAIFKRQGDKSRLPTCGSKKWAASGMETTVVS